MKTCGIYQLIFLENNTYIGKSSNIEIRITNHKSLIRHKKHYNYLLNQQDISTMQVNILEICNENDLSERENYWVNSLNPTLNIAKIHLTGSGGMEGEAHGMSIYSNEQLLNVLTQLADGISYSDIEKNTSVHYQTIASIVAGNKHTWLKTAMPEEYSKALNRKRDKPEYIVTNGTNVYTVTVPKVFCEANNINYSNFVQMLKGKRKSAAGFRRTV